LPLGVAPILRGLIQFNDISNQTRPVVVIGHATEFQYLVKSQGVKFRENFPSGKKNL
jgi:hypothetical protein